MVEGTHEQVPRKRGRPRDERTRAAIIAAALELLAEGGMSMATIEGIAARAGCSKVTIYRWWPSRAAVLLEGLFDLTRDSLVVPDGANVKDVLRDQVAATLALFREGVAGSLLRTLAGEAVSDPDVAHALQRQWVGPRRDVCLRILADAVARGEMHVDTDLEAATDQLFGPLYYRLIFGHAPLDEDLPRVLVDQLLRGLRPASEGRLDGLAPEDRLGAEK
jgi:AcrR family transcriptional regulator